MYEMIIYYSFDICRNFGDEFVLNAKPVVYGGIG
jgi:hypothetical protein